MRTNRLSQMKKTVRPVLGLIAFAVLSVPGAFAQSLVDSAVDQPETSYTGLLDNNGKGQLQTIRQNAKPFGYMLFGGGFGNDQTVGLNADYLVSPGDRVSIRIWGATTFDAVQTVDTQGNIFIPNVGPVKLGSVPNRAVNTVVKKSISQVYTNDVQVYTNLITAQMASIYVTGYVKKPGKYSGVPSSSVLNFIDQAGGIDAASGSYRDIEIVRKSNVIATIDLYDFIQHGRMPDVVFKDGDAIVVKPLMQTVFVQGEVAKPYRFEHAHKQISGDDVISLAGPGPGVTHAALSHIRNGESVFEYVTLEAFSRMSISDGDVVSFKSDLNDRNITINIEGAFVGASALTVGRRATLRQVLDLIEVDPALSAYQRIYIKRKSIAKRQKLSIDESLKRLESEFLTASSSTDGEARIRVQEAQLISEFVRKVERIEPQGTLVVVANEGVADIVLENDDTIFIPRKNPSVLVGGEVRLPRAFLWSGSSSAGDYIAQAGGFSNNANRNTVLVVKQDGRVLEAKSASIDAGDELLVLPKAPTKNLQLATSITDILYKIAVATSVALSI